MGGLRVSFDALHARFGEIDVGSGHVGDLRVSFDARGLAPMSLALVAQWVGHLPTKPRVAGLSPAGITAFLVLCMILCCHVQLL